MKDATKDNSVNPTFTSVKIIGDTAKDLCIAGSACIDKNLTVKGNFTVEGSTEYSKQEVQVVSDKNTILGYSVEPTDSTASGGGLILLSKAGHAKSMIWNNDCWNFNQNVNIGKGSTENDEQASGNCYQINNKIVLTENGLGNQVKHSNLKSVGKLKRFCVDTIGSITDITVSYPCVITTKHEHCLCNDDVVIITESDCVPTVNGKRQIKVIGPFQFSIDAQINQRGTSGKYYNCNSSINIGGSGIMCGNLDIRSGGCITLQNKANNKTIGLNAETGQLEVRSLHKDHAGLFQSDLKGNFRGSHNTLGVESKTNNCDTSSVSIALRSENEYNGTNTSYGNFFNTLKVSAGYFRTRCKFKYPFPRICALGLEAMSIDLDNKGANVGLIAEGKGKGFQSSGVIGLADGEPDTVCLGVTGVTGANRNGMADFIKNNMKKVHTGLFGYSGIVAPNHYAFYSVGKNKINGDLEVTGQLKVKNQVCVKTVNDAKFSIDDISFGTIVLKIRADTVVDVNAKANQGQTIELFIMNDNNCKCNFENELLTGKRIQKTLLYLDEKWEIF